MMKFRDPKTGEVFENIKRGVLLYCEGRNCFRCEIRDKGPCFGWPEKHPSEAATIMGYEVIEDEKEVNMEKKDKPRLAEVLGVDVGEMFRVKGKEKSTDIYIDKDGSIVPCEGGWCFLNDVLDAINHPESIIRAPRLTEAELAIMRATGARWVSRDSIGFYRIKLWKNEPVQKDGIYDGCEYECLAHVYDASLFPSVKWGDCIEVEVTGDDQ